MVNNNSPQTTSYVWRRHNYTLLKIVKSVHVVYIKFSITTVFVTVLGIRSHVFTEKKMWYLQFLFMDYKIENNSILVLYESISLK